MLEFRTPGFNPYAVQYSPYYDSRVAVASSANFGIIGNGKLFVLELTGAGAQIGKAWDTNDAQFDVAWSEINENQLLVACGDGSLKLFDLSVDNFPVMNFHEHKREALSVSWSPVTKDSFLTSSWDGTVKLVSLYFFFPHHHLSSRPEPSPSLGHFLTMDNKPVVTDTQPSIAYSSHWHLHVLGRLLPVESGHCVRRVQRLPLAHL